MRHVPNVSVLLFDVGCLWSSPFDIGSGIKMAIWVSKSRHGLVPWSGCYAVVCA